MLKVVLELIRMRVSMSTVARAISVLPPFMKKKLSGELDNMEVTDSSNKDLIDYIEEIRKNKDLNL